MNKEEAKSSADEPVAEWEGDDDEDEEEKEDNDEDEDEEEEAEEEDACWYKWEQKKGLNGSNY